MLRAVSQDKMAASLVAINVKKVTLIGNIVGTRPGRHRPVCCTAPT